MLTKNISNVVAMTGISGSGKDYLVNYLVQEKGYIRVSFSDQLKELAHKIFPWFEIDYAPIVKETPLNIVTSMGEEIKLTPREIWLKLNFLRDIEDLLFIRMLEEKIERITDKTPEAKIIISDIRPQIEWNWCKRNNIKCIYIEPSKLIYEPNDFDKVVHSYKESADFIFENKFNGIEDFIEFVKLNNL